VISRHGHTSTHYSGFVGFHCVEVVVKDEDDTFRCRLRLRDLRRKLRIWSPVKDAISHKVKLWPLNSRAFPYFDYLVTNIRAQVFVATDPITLTDRLSSMLLHLNRVQIESSVTNMISQSGKRASPNRNRLCIIP
jgi:hypothetical protein